MEETAGVLQNIPAGAGEKKGISGSTIKLIAVLSMLIDHTAAVILLRQIMAEGYRAAALAGESALESWLAAHGGLYLAYEVMRSAGRLGFPLFCFLLAEGFRMTGDVRKYGLRLGIFALISELPFNLAIAGSLFTSGYQNVYFTLFLGLFVLCVFDFFRKCGLPGARERLPEILWGIFRVTGPVFIGVYLGVWLSIRFLPGSPNEMRDYLSFTGNFTLPAVLICGVCCGAAWTVLFLAGRKKGKVWVRTVSGDLTVLVLVMYLAELLRTDYAGMGVLTVAVMYLFRENRVKSAAAGCIVLTLMSASEVFAFLALIPVAIYNGRRGLKMKYFFYIFYPAHLLLLYLIAVWMGLGDIRLL